MTTIHLCNYGIGNTFNVKRALEYVGAEVKLCSNGHDLSDARAVVIPGVGAFSDCIQAFRNREFESAISELVSKDVWVLGICVGMQLLASASEEFGLHKGTNLIQGNVEKLFNVEELPMHVKLPHVGWAPLQKFQIGWDDTILTSVSEGSPVYFVHSYNFNAANDHEVLAVADYYGARVTAAVKKNRIIGLQFHPEKSGGIGLQILAEFVKQVGDFK
jgi:imidazole glycerol-phosphate synthase subunit HisH